MLGRVMLTDLSIVSQHVENEMIETETLYFLDIPCYTNKNHLS